MNSAPIPIFVLLQFQFCLWPWLRRGYFAELQTLLLATGSFIPVTTPLRILFQLVWSQDQVHPYLGGNWRDQGDSSIHQSFDSCFLAERPWLWCTAWCKGYWWKGSTEVPISFVCALWDCFQVFVMLGGSKTTWFSHVANERLSMRAYHWGILLSTAVCIRLPFM